MDEWMSRIWHTFLGGLDGPLHFRFILQPAMAIFFAIRDGVADAHAGRTPYFASLVTEPATRKDRTIQGWNAISRIFVLAVGVDVIYQLIAVRRVRPVERLLAATILALVPYMIGRGPVNRLASFFLHRKLVEKP